MVDVIIVCEFVYKIIIDDKCEIDWARCVLCFHKPVITFVGKYPLGSIHIELGAFVDLC